MIFLTSLLGFLAPWVGEVFKFFTVKGDRTHEIEMFKLRLQGSAQDHIWKMEEINAKADIAEAKATHSPMVSFGVQLLDKASHAGMPSWVIVPAFWLFALLDWITGMVRPGITIAVVAFYMFYRYATVKAIQEVIQGHSLANAVMQVWGENDWAILFMVLAYWFGDRTRQKFMKGK